MVEKELKKERTLYKYAPPTDVKKFFNNIDVNELLYKNKIYKRESFNEVLNLEPFGVGQLEEIFIKYPYLDGTDFTQAEFKDDIFVNNLQKLLKEISELNDCGESESWLVTLTHHDFSTNPKFIIDSDKKIFKIDTNACSGVDMNISTYIKNKKNYLGTLNYKIELINRDDILEEVHKYYYYKKDYENSPGTGAGTLTGWLTQEAAENRSQNKTLIKLNKNFRLK